MSDRVFSLGHSDLQMDRFIHLLIAAGATAVADVRSVPGSGRSPWFSGHNLSDELEAAGLEYRFLGNELGGRPKSPALYRNGVADYVAMAKTASFAIGIKRILVGLNDHRIALLCSEKDPLHCHRCLLVARALAAHNVDTCHLNHNGGSETQQEVEERLLREEGMLRDEAVPWSYRLQTAYEARRRRFAYSPGPLGERRMGAAR